MLGKTVFKTIDCILKSLFQFYKYYSILIALCNFISGYHLRNYCTECLNYIYIAQTITQSKLMSSSYSVRFASHPSDFKSYDTNRLRELFLIEDLFVNDKVKNIYSLYDRLIVGGAMPTTKPLLLETLTELKSTYYLERKELDIIKAGSTGTITSDGCSYKLENTESRELAT